LDKFDILNEEDFSRKHSHQPMIIELPLNSNHFRSSLQLFGRREDQLTKPVKQKLFHFLSNLSNLVGNPERPLPIVLQSQMFFWNANKTFLESRVHEMIGLLQDLPESYKEDNYAPLLKQMMEDHSNKLKSSALRKEGAIICLNWLETILQRMQLLKEQLLNSLIRIRIKPFKKLNFESSRKSFISKFEANTLFSMSEKCQCSVLNYKNCEPCTGMSRVVKQFMKNVLKEISKNSEWKEKRLETLALKHLERNLMGYLFKRTFVLLDEDVLLKRRIQDVERRKVLEPADFEIPEKFHTEAPWPSAEAELRKINSYTAPHDKYLCISRCCDIISQAISSFEEPGADSTWPIMGFVIYASRMDSVLSNVNYINLYTNLNELESSRLLTFTSGIRVLEDTVSKLEISL